MKPMSPSAAHGRLKTIAIKSSHKGLLHEDLGVPQGENIPAAKLREARNSADPAVRKRAV